MHAKPISTNITYRRVVYTLYELKIHLALSLPRVAVRDIEQVQSSGQSATPSHGTACRAPAHAQSSVGAVYGAP